jgi:hypothetical protein
MGWSVKAQRPAAKLGQDYDVVGWFKLGQHQEGVGWISFYFSQYYLQFALVFLIDQIKF